MTSESKIIVKLEAETKKLQTELNRANTKLDRFSKDTKKATKSIQKSFKSLGTGLQAAIGAIGFASLTKSIVDATAKQEAAVKQLEAGLASTGNIVGQSIDELTKKASELQNATTFGDEDIIAAQSQLLTFTNVIGDQFDKTIEAALDLSTRMDQDLKTSVVQLGKALNDPIKNLSALSRAGIQFSEDQQTLIKSLAESGQMAEAQTLILAELEKQFGGSAVAARDTFGGALTSLKNTLGDLLESDSGLGAAQDAIEELTATLSDPAVKEGINALTGAIIKGFSEAARAIASVTNGVRFLAEEFAAWVTGPAVGDIPRIEEELAEVEARMISLGKSRSNANKAELKELKQRKAVLEGMLEASRDLQTFEVSQKPSAPASKPQASITPVSSDALTESYKAQGQAVESVDTKTKNLIETLDEVPEKTAQVTQSIQSLKDEEATLPETPALDMSIPEFERPEEQGGEMASRFKSGFESELNGVFYDAITGEFTDIEGAFSGLLNRMAAQAAAEKLTSSLFGGVDGGGGLIGGALDFFGGAFAEGGRPPMNKISLVGENGPELFVPDAAGTIIPNDQIKMGGNNNISMNFSGISDANEAKRAAGVAGRQAAKALREGNRYS